MDRWRPKREENPPPRDGGEAGPEDDDPYDAELRLAGLVSGPGEQSKELPEQTENVERAPIVWDRANRKHLLDDHPERGVGLSDIEEVLNDPDRLEVYEDARECYRTLGRTEAGRWLVVAWVELQEGRYPVHAHQAGRRTLKRWHE